MEKEGKSGNFVLGFEESYGYLGGDYVRDKDAVGACMLIAEMASFYKKQGLTLVDALSSLYAGYGKYQHKLVSKEFEGADGAEKMKNLLAGLRQSDVTEIGGLKVINFTDYLTQTKYALPRANVLCYDLEGGAQIIIRPSGTEPLIKFYLTAASGENKNKEIFSKLTEFIEKRFK
jgi:phosphoglucomutase